MERKKMVIKRILVIKTWKSLKKSIAKNKITKPMAIDFLTRPTVPLSNQAMGFIMLPHPQLYEI